MSNVLNKKALAEKIAEKCELNKKQSEAIVNVVFDEIKTTLEEKGTVDIYGFGKFELSHREAREGINPLTKQKMTFAASNSVKFKSSKALKDAVNNK